MTARVRILAFASAIASLIAPAAAAQVPYERLVAAGSEPTLWLTYSGTYAGHRFSPLSEITPANVARLRPEWVYQVQQPGPVQVTPLVADGVMYITEARSRVAALDLRTGRTLWRYEPDIPKDVRLIGFGPTNRGVALLDDRVFVGTLDARLVALDARTGPCGGSPWWPTTRSATRSRRRHLRWMDE